MCGGRDGDVPPTFFGEGPAPREGCAVSKSSARLPQTTAASRRLGSVELGSRPTTAGVHIISDRYRGRTLQPLTLILSPGVERRSLREPDLTPTLPKVWQLGYKAGE
jgi:hypothetical protein